jgi:hypothetical protein
MVVQVWKRLKESEVKEYGGMLPARVVLEHNESDHSYRTYLETFSPAGEPGYMYGRYFYLEEEAAEDFDNRVRWL